MSNTLPDLIREHSTFGGSEQCTIVPAREAFMNIIEVSKLEQLIVAHKKL